MNLVTLKERKAETRRKIAAGGLVFKAGLADEASNVLLGILLEAAGALQSDGAELARRRWERLGRAAFEAEGAGDDAHSSRHR